MSANGRLGIEDRLSRLGPIGGAMTFRPLKIDSVQFGAKSGRHMREFGRDPSKDSDRQWLVDYIKQIYADPKQIREGTFSGQGEQLPQGSHARGVVWFYANADDVVITDREDNYVTILKGGVLNTSFLQAKMLTTRPVKFD
jgi:hypothetical protein